MKTMSRLLVLCSLACALMGCKLSIMVNEGGRVVSFSGTNDCAESSICTIDVNSPTFSDSFVAIVEPGYEFVRWQGGVEFFCGDSTSPICNITLAGNPIDQFIVDSFRVGYLMPVFKDVGIDTDNDGVRNELDDDDDNDGIFDVSDACPLDPDPLCGTGVAIIDTITVGGKEWAQVDLFHGLGWDDIDAVCNDGPCAGVLNGWNVSGWIWASLDEVHELINTYIGLPTPVSNYEEDDSTFAPAFFFDGWRPRNTGFGYSDLSGFPHDHPLVPHPLNPDVMIEVYFCLEISDNSGPPFTSTDTYVTYGFESCNTPIGAWIYRDL